jgi:hypothetical protein
MKAELKFLEELEGRAREQHRLIETEIIPDWARGIGGWLTVHPWRVIVPISALAYFLLRIVFGYTYSEFVLGLFGGFI